jgi:hypothetical protein
MENAAFTGWTNVTIRLLKRYDCAMEVSKNPSDNTCTKIKTITKGGGYYE